MAAEKKQLKADFLLLLITLAWGVSYYLSDLCLTDLGAMELNAWRFLIAFFAAIAISLKKLRNISRDTLKYSALVGALLALVYGSFNIGLMHTSLTNSAFLCSLAVVITPIIGIVFLRKKPSKKLFFVIVVAFLGIMLLTLNETMRPNIGDIFSIICSISYAADLVLTEHAVKKESVNAFQLGVFQLGFTGLFMLVLTLIF